MRQIFTHTDNPDTCQEKITCLDDEAGFYAIEIEQVNRTFGHYLYDLFNAGDKNAFEFSKLNLEKRTRWEVAASNLLRHAARNPPIKIDVRTESAAPMNGVTVKALLAICADFVEHQPGGDRCQALKHIKDAMHGLAL